tara:strand:+ start:266 stop:664 length:399 start_codon:yes stop_codon:yes gene_type:complete
MNYKRINDAKNKVKLSIFIIKLVIKTIKVKFYQKINKINIKKIDNKRYEMSYVLNGKLYSMIIKEKRGPITYLQISNDESDDVTDIVSKYYGPERNWHNNELTPEFFGFEELTFEMKTGESINFKKEDVVKI